MAREALTGKHRLNGRERERKLLIFVSLLPCSACDFDLVLQFAGVGVEKFAWDNNNSTRARRARRQQMDLLAESRSVVIPRALARFN